MTLVSHDNTLGQALLIVFNRCIWRADTLNKIPTVLELVIEKLKSLSNDKFKFTKSTPSWNNIKYRKPVVMEASASQILQVSLFF